MIARYLKSAYHELEPREALGKPPTYLLGVNEAGGTVLKEMQIESIFDLALSGVFRNAALLTSSGDLVTSLLSKYGGVPSDVVDAGTNGGVATLPAEDIEVLAGVGHELAQKLHDTFDVDKVRDLAYWPPYRAAQSILQAAYGSDLDVQVLTGPDEDARLDPEAPADLLPKSGDYPTERVFYTTLLMDEVKDDVSALQDLEQSGPIDVLGVAEAEYGFTKPATGAMLTYSQSWFRQGVALGQLLHSVALAPGESTRLAMIDWSRRVMGSTTEDIVEAEALTSETGHNRAISEVTNAVATEAQSGFSRTGSSSSSHESGSSGGGSILIASGGWSEGSSDTQTEGWGYSSSSGRRQIAAEMTQNVNDSTQQAANATRNRRATIVHEVSQAESEQVSTRIVTNYNHMHALSIHYYEVVQLYRVVAELSQVDKCLFVPLKLVDFRRPAAVQENAPSLERFALRPEIGRILSQVAGHRLTVKVPVGPGPDPAPEIEASPQVSESAVPRDANLAGIDLAGSSGVAKVVINRRSGGPVFVGANGRLAEKVPFADISSLEFVGDQAGRADVKLKLLHANGSRRMLGLDVPVATATGSADSVAVSSGPEPTDEVVSHLQTHRLHYNQAIWRSLDAAGIALLLSHYKFEGKPLTQLVDPTPVAMIGNFLVFKMHADEKAGSAWADHLKELGLDSDRRELSKNQRIVPLPSGGVFGEAVLGRYNSAEKLDLTRFWDWQDSPIPDHAPEIAPIQTGSRGQDDPLRPGQLGQPLVNIVSPTALPDPQGLGAVLAAVQNGNMFRDMSGLAAAAGLAQAGLQAASEGAAHAGTQAGANMATAAQTYLEALKTIAPMIAGAMGVPVPPSGSSTKISNEGAKINHGAKLDEKFGTGGSAGGGGGGLAPSTVRHNGNGAAPAVEAGEGSSAGGQGTGAVPYEVQAFESAIGGGGPGMGSGLGGLAQTIASTVLGATPASSSRTTPRTDSETVVVLELGDSRDSKAFVEAAAGHGVLNATPPASESFRGFPTPISQWTAFPDAPPPDWWLSRFVREAPLWVYLSGHFTGRLYNTADSFSLNFNNPAADNNALWRFRAEDGSHYQLDERCRVIMMMGCSAAGHLPAARRIQGMFSKDATAPVILGFHGSCPVDGGTQRLVRLFMDELGGDWANHLDHSHLVTAWLSAAEKWNHDHAPNVGYVDPTGSAFMADVSARPWKWVPAT